MRLKSKHRASALSLGGFTAFSCSPFRCVARASRQRPTVPCHRYARLTLPKPAHRSHTGVKQGKHGPDQSLQSAWPCCLKVVISMGMPMGVPDFRIFSTQDAGRFGYCLVDLGANMANFRRKKIVRFYFGRNKFPNSQPKFLFVNSDLFSAKKKIAP